MSRSKSVGKRTLKSMLFTYSKIKEGVLDWIKKEEEKEEEKKRRKKKKKKNWELKSWETGSNSGERWPHLLVSDDVKQLDDVHTSVQVLEDFDLPLNLLLLHGLEDLDDASLIVHNVDSLKNLTVLATTELLDNLVVVLLPIINNNKKEKEEPIWATIRSNFFALLNSKYSTNPKGDHVIKG